MRADLGLLLALGLVAGCAGDRVALDRAALDDPVTCQPCHPDHYREWSGSMHAYASDDPLFVALNARGQRQTAGALGDFCIKCHAPMAALTGASTDGLDLAALPRRLKGIGCTYCHAIDDVRGTHDNALHRAGDGVMRGGLADPQPTEAHRSAYSPLHDGKSARSSELCGACHDVVTPAGVELERTFAEWKQTLFATGAQAVSCGGCHMPTREGRAAEVPGAPVRRLHEHAMPGVDVALEDWPEAEAQRALIQRDLGPALSIKVCPPEANAAHETQVTLDNVLVGHAWPSGVTHARRAWVEVVARRGGQVVYQSGVVPEGAAVEGAGGPDLWVLGSWMYDARGAPVMESWNAVRQESTLLGASVTSDVLDPRFYHAVTRAYPVPGGADSISVALRLRPVDLDVIDDLVASGELDPAVRARVPTFTIVERTWSAAADGRACR